jgi:hypothetical protein
MDGVNRNRELEKELQEFRKSAKGHLPYFDALWSTWMILKEKDVDFLQSKVFSLVRGNLYLAALHFSILEEEKKYYDYVLWFFENRIRNTGKDGFAKCEMSELYTPHRRRKKK